ncbi:hypothetical protein PANA5342_2446 [Pantoea ananatis LMG 5342]|nr:hypothetical protein PANA5342_2446 [Pantoea ananatis LMG 5342]
MMRQKRGACCISCQTKKEKISVTAAAATESRLAQAACQADINIPQSDVLEQLLNSGR